jgi:hypothetical protein
MEVARSYVTSVDVCPKDTVRHNHRCEILREVQNTLANPVTFNRDRNIKNKKSCSHFGPYFKRIWDSGARWLRAVMGKLFLEEAKEKRKKKKNSRPQRRSTSRISKVTA